MSVKLATLHKKKTIRLHDQFNPAFMIFVITLLLLENTQQSPFGCNYSFIFANIYLKASIGTRAMTIGN